MRRVRFREKKSTRYSRVLVVTELAVSGTQCTFIFTRLCRCQYVHPGSRGAKLKEACAIQLVHIALGP